MVMFMGPSAYITPSWYPTFQISPKLLPNRQVSALSRVELFYLLNSPRRGAKKNGTF